MYAVTAQRDLSPWVGAAIHCARRPPIELVERGE